MRLIQFGSIIRGRLSGWNVNQEGLSKLKFINFIILRALLLVVLLSAPAHAEIEKVSLNCKAGICLYWWPMLPKVDGWHAEVKVNYNIGVNSLVHDGSTFKDSTTVMYAKAS